MERLRSDVEAAMPQDGDWSNNILFGTSVSNQRLYLVHRLTGELRDEVLDDVQRAASEV